jgi:branched-chain amino acid transport system substrate-binding protein
VAKRLLFLVIAGILSISLLIVGCPPPQVEPVEPIRIGGSLPLTGIFSDLGKWVYEGYKYWAESINARGGLLGRPVELIIYDDASRVDLAVAYLERAITVDRVDLIFGGYPGTAASAQMPIAERHRMVYVSMGGHMPSFLLGYKYSFGGPPLMGEWWYEGIFDWLETLPVEERPRRVAMITMNNPIGMAVFRGTPDRLAQLGMEIVVDELYDLPLADATPLVAMAKAAGADAFFANGFFADGVLTVRAMKALDYNPKLFVQGVGSIIPAWVMELGADGDYVMSGTPMHHKLPFPGMAELNAVAMERFDLPAAPLYFLFGYAWMQTLQRGVEGAGSLDHDAIRDYLRTHPISTIGGVLTFDELGLPEPYSFATQVIDGKVELIWPPEVATAPPVYPMPTWDERSAD